MSVKPVSSLPIYKRVGQMERNFDGVDFYSQRFIKVVISRGNVGGEFYSKPFTGGIFFENEAELLRAAECMYKYMSSAEAETTKILKETPV
jgi:hypothetical protein